MVGEPGECVERVAHHLRRRVGPHNFTVVLVGDGLRRQIEPLWRDRASKRDGVGDDAAGNVIGRTGLPGDMKSSSSRAGIALSTASSAVAAVTPGPTSFVRILKATSASTPRLTDLLTATSAPLEYWAGRRKPQAGSCTPITAWPAGLVAPSFQPIERSPWRSARPATHPGSHRRARSTDRHPSPRRAPASGGSFGHRSGDRRRSGWRLSLKEPRNRTWPAQALRIGTLSRRLWVAPSRPPSLRCSGRLALEEQSRPI